MSWFFMWGPLRWTGTALSYAGAYAPVFSSTKVHLPMLWQPFGISTIVMGRPSKALSPTVLVEAGSVKAAGPKAGIAFTRQV